MLIGRVRVFVDNLRWLSTLLINTLLPELLQLNAEFNLYSWIVDKVCHNCLEIELSFFFQVSDSNVRIGCARVL